MNKLISKKLFLIAVIGSCSVLVYLRFFPIKQIILNKQISLQNSEFPAIAGFYHFSTIGRHWKNIVDEQMSIIYRSGLFNSSSNTYVTGLGKIDDNKTAYDIFSCSKFIYEYDNRTQLYEYPALMKLEKFCFHNNKSLVWYAHSKGASHANDFVAGPWRGVLNYFILDKWELCYNLLLSTNYTTCGAILTFDHFRKSGWNTYYAGNMWWAKCSHVNRLTRLEKIDEKDRYLAELYVTSEPDVGHFNCHFINLNIPINFNKQTANCTINEPMWWVR
ncbi:unnamed protein product [Adineta steineri]|uniref:Uncharacterized protein n=1 Tax=Adineta steineri TaxID=433720 RepID=A0A814GSS6_9BILA|nr:unnamed protein product [Adineta steineri]CAF3978568.1 unnamed protein product [Adineta steineri]